MSDLASRLLAGDELALARAISWVESGGLDGQRLLKQVRPAAGNARVVGITGSPGSGKSTLVSGIVGAARAGGERVAVVAVDPSSPFSGGAILGDRIRMTEWHADPGVFIRSMATRGQLGGLAAATMQVVALLDAAGFELVLIETVGVGQSEVDIVRAADTTALLLTPEAGDDVQAVKAGVMEIADVYALNKVDLPGADRLRREVRAALGLSKRQPGAWRPVLVATNALSGEGIPELIDALDRHHAFLAAHGGLEPRRQDRVRFEILAMIGDRLRRALQDRSQEAVAAVMAGTATPEEVVRELMAAPGDPASGPANGGAAGTTLKAPSDGTDERVD